MRIDRAGNKGLIREINEALVLAELRGESLHSRADIARNTGLSGPTVTAITSRLIDRGLVEERATAASAGGRPPVLLGLRQRAGYVVGIKLTENRAIGVLTDLDANVVARADAALAFPTPGAVVAGIVNAVEALAPAGHGRILGVGLGMGGVIDRDAGSVRHATYFDWHNEPLASRLSEAIGLPVLIDNDVNALVASEQSWGAGRGVKNFALVTIGRGVGMGMVLDGRLFRGSRGGAGEFGHMKVVPEGPECECGGRGCLEAVIGEPALLGYLAGELGRRVTVDEAGTMARDGDQHAARVFAEAGQHLGRAVGNVVNILNPDRLLLAGEGTHNLDLIMPAFRRALNETVFDGLQDGLSIHAEAWDDEAWARGAASLLLNELFEPNLRLNSDEPTLIGRTAG
ncbi:ROK family transcriptional regulator [Arthrobacter sp. B2a2-09]|uniref:ROK family transcriptional regulator n=1 Tax=Arthrobacter sp. B2a2-09 TaxID=2952822 RepID=UPI0022CD8686|nr:ROK family transcriptional regulator [Arthrobacter sp. B2a2-09]MCZ9883126.1 ROK family transcriptional regulator [Arthrobacter sp. B2a2-09]